MLSLVLISACLCLFWMFLRGSEGPKLPVQPGAWPLIGNTFDIAFKDCAQLWESIKKYTYFTIKNGGVTQANFGPVKLYIITDPDDYHTVSNICLHKAYMYKFATLFCSGLVLVDPPMWKFHRKLFNRAFNQEHLKNYMDIFNEECKTLCDKIVTEVGRGMFKPDSYISNHLFIIACRTFYGRNFDEHNKISSTYIDIIERAFAAYALRLTKIWLHVPFIYNRSSLKRECDELTKPIKDITHSIVKKRKLELQEAKKTGNNDILHNGDISLLDLLIDVQEKEGISETELQERIDSMIVTNYDTTSTGFLVILKLIASHPDIQEKIYKELKIVFDEPKWDLTRHDILKLVYLEAVIKEALRVYPTVPIVARKASEEVKLKDYTIPAGGFYLLSIYGMHRLAMWGADAEQFRPERWLEPGGVPDNAYVYGAFSIGKRNCLGKSYAMMSMKVTLAHLLLRYRITADDSKIKWTWNTFLKPISGHEISIELRT